MFYNKYDIIGTQLLVATNCSKSLNCPAISAYKNTNKRTQIIRLKK